MTRVSVGNKLLVVQAEFLGNSASGKAFKAALYVGLEEVDEESIATLWLPHSRVKTPEGCKVDANYKDRITIAIPLWLAEKNNFDSYFKEKLVDNEYGEEEDPLDFEEDIPF